MSSEEVRRVSRQDIQLVQNLIERCLQLYMNQKEVMETLLAQAKIEPSFTELVWQKLEEENQEFFRAYNIRLVVKRQITIFNKLLEKQAELMCKIGPAGAAMQPISNGSHASALRQTPACYVSENKLPPSSENMHHQFAPNASNSLLNNELSLHKMLHSAANTSACAKRMDVLPNMISAQNPQMGTIQGINGIAIKSESGYSNSSAFTYGADGNVLGAHSTIGDASVASLSTVESNSQHLDEPLLDTDSSSFGFLGQIPRNFSLSDLTADFSQSSDILENYCRSPYLAEDTYNFLDPMDKGECPDRR